MIILRQTKRQEFERVGVWASTYWRDLVELPATLLLGLLRFYQLLISPLTGATCRYYPSCSAYAVQAIGQHGALRGTCLTAWRLLRCNPFSHGGVDHVPQRVNGYEGTVGLTNSVDPKEQLI